MLTEASLRKRRRLSPQARREELLAALAQVVAERGLAGATVSRVVAAAGASQGSFYRYFADLDDAFATLAARVLEPIAAAAFALDFSAAQCAADVERELLSYYEVLAAQLALHPALIREALFAGLTGGKGLGAPVAGFLGAMHQFARSLAERHAGHRPFDAGDPEIIASALLGMVVGAAYQATVQGDRFDPEHWAREMARYETKALCVRAPGETGDMQWRK